MSDLIGWILSLVGGSALWSAAVVLGGRREPWDSPSYWTVWLPIALLLAALVGFLAPNRSWRWPITIMLIQLPVMMFVGGSDASLLPLGVILLLFLSIPGVVAARAGAWLRRLAAA